MVFVICALLLRLLPLCLPVYLILSFKYVSSSAAVFPFPASIVLNISKRSGMLIARIGTSLELETSGDFQTDMSCKVPNVPKLIWLTVEDSDDDGATWCE